MLAYASIMLQTSRLHKVLQEDKVYILYNLLSCFSSCWRQANDPWNSCKYMVAILVPVYYVCKFLNWEDLFAWKVYLAL